MDPKELSTVKGNPFFKKTYYSTILSTNIALAQYLANVLFDDDLGRLVWASSDKMFRKRQEQVLKRSPNIGTLDFPFCSFRLTQDSSSKSTKRPWRNQALNVEGVWIEELGRKVRVTPIQINYEGVVCVQHDTDLYWLQQLLVWDDSNETLLAPVLETVSDSGKKEEIKNIAVVDLVPHMNSRFQEDDWVRNNKIQTIDLDIQIDTYLLLDNRAGYWLTVKSTLEFINGMMPEILIAARRKGDDDDYPPSPLILPDPKKATPEDIAEILRRHVFS